MSFLIIHFEKSLKHWFPSIFFYLIRSYDDVLVTKGNGHDRDEKSEEGFQLSKAVLVEAQEREGVGDGDQDAAPERNRFVGKQINCNGSPDNFLQKNMLHIATTALDCLFGVC